MLQGVQRGRLRIRLRGHARDMDAARSALAVVRATAPGRRRGNFDQEVEEDVTDVWAQERAKDWRRGSGVGDGSCVDVESGILGGGVGAGHAGQVGNARRTNENGHVEGECAGDDEGTRGFIRRSLIPSPHSYAPGPARHAETSKYRLTTGRRIAIVTVSILALFILINIFPQFKGPFTLVTIG